MKMDYKGNVDTSIGSLFKEVGKEIIHQTTGHVFEEEDKVNVLAETSKAYGDAIGSAFEQQEAYEYEMAEYGSSIDSGLTACFDFNFDFDDSDLTY